MSAVAVVLSYNYGRYLADCLASIDAQTDLDLRVIVIDDCSRDGSQEVIAKWSANTDLRHDVVLKETNRGPAHSYNLAMESIGPNDLVGFLDADDLWLPTKFELQTAAFTDGVAVVYSDVVDLDDVSGERTARTSAILGDQPAMSRLLARGTFVPLNSALVRASAVPRFDETMRLCDLQLWLHAARAGGFLYVPGEVGVVRVHGGSMSHTEGLLDDRLRLLARHARGSQERAWARTRGRRLLNAALVAEQRPRARTFVEYAWRDRDPVALAYLAACAVPGGRRAANLVRTLGRP